MTNEAKIVEGDDFDLPERLRNIAESVTEWDNPLCAKDDLLKAANMLEEQQAEVDLLRDLIRSANRLIQFILTNS